jgi:thioredoxin-related protein
MRFINLLIILFFIKTLGFGQATEGGIVFINDDYKTALTQAKSEKKLIFWDAYTTWCGPCKMMTRNTFPDAQVSSFFNKNFVNLKMDMEKGEGPNLMQQYNIMAYPTLLFINGDGKVIHKALGYHDPSQFLELGKSVLSGDNSFEAWAKKYEDGERSPAFLREYALKLQETLEPNRHQLADEYLATQKDSTTADNLEFILRFVETTDSKYFPFLVKNKSKYPNPEDLDLRISDMVTSRLFDPKNLPTLDNADKLIRMAFPDKYDRLSLKYRLEHARLSDNYKNYYEAGSAYFKKYADVAGELSDAANNLINMGNKKKYLKKAVKWAEQAVKLDKIYLNQLTVARVYERMGKKSKAKSAAEEAIKLAKTNNEPYTEAEQILKNLKQ